MDWRALCKASLAFHTVGAVSTNRIHELFGNVFEIPLSTGTVINIVSSCASKVKPMVDVDRGRDKIADAPLAHFDETGCRVNQRLNWVHVASTNSETYLYLIEKRGSKGMDEGGVLPTFHGIAIHDCWAPYWKYNMGLIGRISGNYNNPTKKQSINSGCRIQSGVDINVTQ